MTVVSYLDHVARLKGIPRNRRRHEIVEAMERCNILGASTSPAQTLRRQPAAGWPRSSPLGPRHSGLDEATAGLDPTQVMRFRELVRSLSDRHGILLSTHILAEVEYCCRRVVMINQGQVVMRSTVDELRQRATQQARLRLRMADDSTTKLAACLAEQDWVKDVSQENDSVLCYVEAEHRRRLISLSQNRRTARTHRRAPQF